MPTHVHHLRTDLHDFLDDKDKLADFLVLTKRRFLESYSYLTEDEYVKTCIHLRQRYGLPTLSLRSACEDEGSKIYSELLLTWMVDKIVDDTQSTPF